jgi:6-phosphofructokinase 1
MRIGILTGGGDCSGLNAVIRAVAKTLIIHHDAEVIGFHDGFLGMIENKYTPLSYREVSGILDRGGTILGTNNKANPLSYFAADGADVSEHTAENYRDLDLDGVVVIGGDGTMSIANAMSEKHGLKFIGVPKTIDNDLVSTERTFGFDTAVGVATEAIDRLQTTGQSHGRIMILETMGRYAGWIAAESALAGGADIVLIPEIPYDMDEVVRVCNARDERQKFTIIVVAEGAKEKDGEMVVRETVEDSPDPVRLGGVANYVKHQIEDRVESEVRAMILGHIQRGGTPTPFDRVLATNYGVHAAEQVVEGNWGQMVALQDGDLTTVPLSDVADQTRFVPLDSPLIRSSVAVGMSFGVSPKELDVLAGTE